MECRIQNTDMYSTLGSVRGSLSKCAGQSANKNTALASLFCLGINNHMGEYLITHRVPHLEHLTAKRDATFWLLGWVCSLFLDLIRFKNEQLLDCACAPMHSGRDCLICIWSTWPQTVLWLAKNQKKYMEGIALRSWRRYQTRQHGCSRIENFNF